MHALDRFVSVSHAKTHLLDLVRTLQTRQDVVAITRDGAPAAVLLSMEQYEGLIETLELLSDAGARRSLRRSLRQATAGRWVSHASVFGRESR
jgi:prevent-host-death family protein